MTLPRLSLRMQLLAVIVGVVLLAAASSLLVGAWLTRRAVDRSIVRDVSQQAALFASRERASVLPLAPAHLASLRPFLARAKEQAVVAPLNRASSYLSERDLQELRQKGHTEGTVSVAGKSWFYAARSVTKKKALVLLRPRVAGAAAWRPYLWGLLIAAGIGVILAVAVSFLLARRIARPVRRVAEASRRLAVGERPAAVPVEGAIELASLANSFNNMARELEHARDSERAFLLSVSHELKTPLTAVLGYAEAIADGTVDPESAASTIAKEAERLDRLVRDLLDLARMNRNTFSVRNESVDLAEIAAECGARHEVQAEAFGIKLVVDAADSARARGDADRILQAASNLVENALRVSPADGTVRIVARPGMLSVEDEGPGLKADEIPRAFERFFLHSRYAASRNVGTGLGLAIVDELARAMGGRVEVRSRPGSTSFAISLPQDGRAARIERPRVGSPAGR